MRKPSKRLSKRRNLSAYVWMWTLVEGQETVVGKSVILHTDRDTASGAGEAWEQGMSQLQTSTKTYAEVLER